MKKTILLFFLMSVLASFITAGEEMWAFLFPKGGENLIQGDRKEISWVLNPSANYYHHKREQVKIELYQNDQLVGTIIPSIWDDANAFTWIVGKLEGKTASAGSNYQLRMNSLTTAINNWAKSRAFTISFATDSPGYSTVPKKGDCVITGFSIKPMATKKNMLIIETNVENRLGSPVRGLTLRLIKNHLLLKEWKSVNLGPHAKARTHYQDPMPAPFHTSYYIVELIWGNSPGTPGYVILDTKQGQYRKAGVVIGR